MHDELIAVTGATGAVGSRVARGLGERGARLSLVVRDLARAPRLEGAEVRAASGYGAGDEMRAGTVMLIPAAEAPDRVEQHKRRGRRVAAGVRRLVYLSFLGAAPDATFTLARDHWAT
jgi:uncharacterized protein YbjT (DUF2867 family)